MKNASQPLLPLSDERFQSITNQIFGTYANIDTALAHTLRLSGDLVETAQEIGLEPNVSQALFADVSVCLGTMLQTRKEFLKVHRRAHSIRSRTTKAWEGCPFSLDEEPVAPPVLRAVS